MSGYEPDHRQVLMDDRWVHSAQELAADGLPSYGPVPDDVVLAQVVRAESEGRARAADLLVRRLTGG